MKKLLTISLITLVNRALPLLAQGEFVIDTNIIYGVAPYDQECPSVAFDGSNYFVVWVNDDDEVYGTMVSQTGELLTPQGITIASTPNHVWWPSLVFGGTNYLVVWHDYTSDDIYGCRVSQTGEILDSSSIGISTAPNDQWSPSVSFDGTNYFVVWTDARNTSWDIYGTRVSQAGVVLDPSGIAICTTTNRQCTPSVSFDGTNYFVVWTDERNGEEDIYGTRVSQTGVVIDDTGIAISTAPSSQGWCSIAFDDTNCLVVWQDYRNLATEADIYGARVDTSGEVLDPFGIPICTAPDYQWQPHVSFGGAHYLVVWEDGAGSDNIYGARVTKEGVCLDPSGILLSTMPSNSQRSPCVSSNGSNYFVVWRKSCISSGGLDIYGVRVDQAGTVLDTEEVISTAPYEQKFPSLSFDGTNYFVVWQDYRNGRYSDIYGVRVNPTGEVLDTGIAISTARYDQSCPQISFGGTKYLIVWTDERNGLYQHAIYGARVNQVGIVLDDTGIVISNASNDQWNPSVSFDGTNYFVVWTDERNGSWIVDIYGARVNQAGVVLDDTGIAISTAPNDQWSPSVSFDGTNYFVVWTDARNTSWDIYGTRVSQAGVVLDPSGIAICTTTNRQCTPSVSFDGTNYFVVWTDYRSGEEDIYGTRVSQTGVVLDPSGIAICTTAYFPQYPSIAFDGTNYLILWERQEDIYGVEVDTSGTIIDTFIVSNAEGEQTTPAIAHGISEQLLITYSSFTDSINGQPVNKMRIWGKFYPFAGVEEKEKLRVERLEFKVHPNPFTQVTSIQYQVAPIPHLGGAAGSTSKSKVSLKIYDLAGRLVRVLIDKEVEDGYHTIKWDGKDSQGKRVSSGVYFCKMEAGDFRAIKKLVTLK
jgi:hypothetical protein